MPRCNDGTAFRIVDPLRFANFCLPRYFKHNKLGSFQAQMLTYGFTRIPNESCLDVSSVRGATAHRVLSLPECPLDLTVRSAH